jgi:hypothetical protein
MYTFASAICKLLREKDLEKWTLGSITLGNIVSKPSKGFYFGQSVSRNINNILLHYAFFRLACLVFFLPVSCPLLNGKQQQTLKSTIKTAKNSKKRKPVTEVASPCDLQSFMYKLYIVPGNSNKH